MVVTRGRCGSLCAEPSDVRVRLLFVCRHVQMCGGGGKLGEKSAESRGRKPGENSANYPGNTRAPFPPDLRIIRHLEKRVTS